MKPSALKLLFSLSSLSFHVVQKLLHFQLMQCSARVIMSWVITRWQFILICVIHSVYLVKIMDLVHKASLDRFRSRSLLMVKVASLRSDTDLNVSGSVIDDKHFPSMMNIPFFRCPQSGCYLLLWLTLQTLPKDTLDHQWREWNE